MGKYFTKLILIVLIVFSSCDRETEKAGNLFDFVPENTDVVLKISDWTTFRNDIKNNSLLKSLNDSDFSKFLSDNDLFLNAFHSKDGSLFALYEEEKNPAFLFITRQSENHFVPDSTKNYSAETLHIDKQIIDRIEMEDKLLFTSVTDSIFIASSSQQLLMDVLNHKTEKSEDFRRIIQLPATDGFTAYFKGNKIQTDSTRTNFTSWSALDVILAPGSIKAHGISIPTDTVPQLLRLFEGQIPQPNRMAEIVPMNAVSAIGFTFNDAEKFQEKLKEFTGRNGAVKPTGIFDSANEIGVFKLAETSGFFITSIDATTTTDALAQYVSSKNTFRDVEIKEFSAPFLFKDLLYPLIPFNAANYVFQINDFFVFTETEKAAQEIIGSHLNNSTLQNAAYFQENTADLSSSSSILIFGMQGEFSSYLSQFSNLDFLKGISSVTFSQYPLFALQYSYDRNFAHIALSAKEQGESSSKSISKGVSEKFHISLKNDILGMPQVFEGNGSHIMVQDVNHTLHFISENGKVLWTKELNQPILGEIQQVDLFKNGNQQMAFATENTLYILDRHGKSVGPFPLKFRDKITQPLSVFDYDGTHDYRFVVTQGKELFMYDKNAKIVTGFGFKKTASDIVQSPVHIRMGNKDYIVIAEKNGKLNILNRMGRTRVSVSENFNFSDIPVTSEDNKFVVITQDYIKKSISDRGIVSSINPDVGDNYWFAMSGNVKATLDDNLLRINGKLAELPLGIYSEPKLYSISRTVYTAITEKQEKKVFLFNENAELIDGFPVFGSSNASIGTRSSKNNFVVVKGDSNGIIVYQLH